MSEINGKPTISSDQATDILTRLYDVTTTEILPLPSLDDQNFYVSANNGNEYVLKITNSNDSKNPTLIEVQSYAMSYLLENGIQTQKVIPTTTGQLWSLQELDCGSGCQEYLVRLLTYLPGMTISKAPLTPQLLFELGKMAARIDKLLLKMQHPSIGVLDREYGLWKLSMLPLLENNMFIFDGDALQEVVKSVIGQFRSSVAPKYTYFRKCIIQGDLNDLNILVQPESNNSFKISGILDFADMHSGFYIHELAITITQMMIVHPNPIEVGGAVLAGWESELPLNEAERDCLYALVLSRLCQLVCAIRHLLLIHPENQYLKSWSKADSVLLDFSKLSKEHVDKVWSHAAAELSALQQ